MTPAAWLLAYCGIIMGASLAGGWLPTIVRLTHTRLQIMISLVAGLMLGVALLHMLPHAAAELPSLDAAVTWTLLGLLGMFFLVRLFHFHQHGSDDEAAEHGHAHAHSHGHSHSHDHNRQHVHQHDCKHDHSHAHSCHALDQGPNEVHVQPLESDAQRAGPEERLVTLTRRESEPTLAQEDPTTTESVGAAAGDDESLAGLEDHTAELLRRGSPYAWLGLTLGLGLHTLIDGLALGASVFAESHGRGEGWLFGVGTFLAIVLHKPLDAMSITTLMRTAGWPLRRQQFANLLFSILCPVGALGFWFGISRVIDTHHHWLGAALAFSAGVFLCISLGDLLPEVHFHSHDRLKLSAALLIGVALAYGVGQFEPKHVHHRPAPQGSPPDTRPHGHGQS